MSTPTEADREAEALAAKSPNLAESAECLDVHDANVLEPGRPHLRIGARVLLRHPLALLIALAQAALIAALVHDTKLFVDSSLRSAQALPPYWLFTLLPRPDLRSHPFILALPLLTYLFPALAAINVGWSIMAAVLARKIPRPASLLSGLMGLVPLRLVAWFLCPKWLLLRGSWREEMSARARFYQISTAYALGIGRPQSLARLDLARAMDKRGREIMDSMSSYIIYPPYFILLLLIPLTFTGSLPQPIDDAYMAVWTSAWIIPAYAFWLAYNRATLFAMVLTFLIDARNGVLADRPDDSHTPDTPKAMLARATSALVVPLLIAAAIWHLEEALSPAARSLPRYTNDYSLVSDDTPRGRRRLIELRPIRDPASRLEYALQIADMAGDSLLVIPIGQQLGGAHVYMPLGSYRLFVACGTTWHGEIGLFGPNTILVETKSLDLTDPAPMATIELPVSEICQPNHSERP